MEPDSENSRDSIEMETPDRVMPSAFMRKLRPEYYSDSEQRTAYVLSEPLLRHHLDTITERNETLDFEIFCRKLCERTICPNLRPQTGPDGGGDSKADAETYPVADEIAGLTYVGEANGGRERWAFAFSAKKKWSEKVRSDVKGIVDTGREYDRIIFVTSQAPKSKTRARVEDELSKKYGIPVTIHDRTWILKEVVEKNRQDLAFNYLKVGEENSNYRLGPTDYSRTQQLEDIERDIADPEAFRDMERQLVSEALVAAKLSRNLERPQIETDGRFVRAVRLADKHGAYKQKIDAQYEQIWSAFWWFDDIKFLNHSYDAFETLALKSDHAKVLELLGNLHQLLINSLVHDHMTRDECHFDERTTRLQQALEVAASDTARPNNSLEAQTNLLRIELNRASMAQDRVALSKLWQDYETVLDKASGLGEFDADTLVRFIEVAGDVAGNDPAYNNLVEKLAKFVGSRKSEGEGAVILLKRAKKLDFDDKFDMIRWLGEAAIGLSKREYVSELIETVQLLTLAYRSAGLPWASRATCIFALASIVMEGEEDSELPVSFVPTIKLWTWNALERCHLPDFLLGIQLMNGCVATLPLTDESKSKLREDIQELEMGLGCMMLNLSDDDLRRLEGVPDILEAFGLVMARTALLYALGYTDLLREDGSLPPEETDEGAQRILSMLKSQPIANSLRGPLLLNEDGSQSLSTTIMGVNVSVEIESSDLIPLAEIVLATLEAFFATIIGERVTPHTEAFRVCITVSDKVQEPSIETDELDMRSDVTWPQTLNVAQFDQQSDVRRFYAELAGHVLGTTCMADDVKSLLQNLYENEALQERITMIATAPTSYTRVTSENFSKLSEWQDAVRRSYPLREDRTELPRIALPSVEDTDANCTDSDIFTNDNHRAMNIRSIIDIHAWDQATWRGCGYFQVSSSEPPTMAFLFENEKAARKIFERWRKRFGNDDKDEEIGISIIRDLPATNPHHYCVQIAPNDLTSKQSATEGGVFVTTRSMIIEPATSQNLDTFLTGFDRCGAFYLLPAIIGLGPNPSFVRDLAIQKHEITVKTANDVGENDIEALALRQRGLKFSS